MGSRNMTGNLQFVMVILILLSSLQHILYMSTDMDAGTDETAGERPGYRAGERGINDATGDTRSLRGDNNSAAAGPGDEEGSKSPPSVEYSDDVMVADGGSEDAGNDGAGENHGVAAVISIKNEDIVSDDAEILLMKDPGAGIDDEGSADSPLNPPEGDADEGDADASLDIHAESPPGVSSSRSSSSNRRHSKRPVRPPDPPFFVQNTGEPGGIGSPSFDNWTLYMRDSTPLLLHQAQFDAPGCSRGGDVNEVGVRHSGFLRYEVELDGTLSAWGANGTHGSSGGGDSVASSGNAKQGPGGTPGTEEKFIYPWEIIEKLPYNDTQLQFKTCALVSNSGSLLEAEFGYEIDQHDAVFRMNNAPTMGFEQHVGMKTTFDLLNRPHAEEVSRMRFDGVPGEMPEVAAVLFEADNWHLYHHILERQLKHMPYPSTLVLSPQFLSHVNSLWMRLAKRWPRHANSCASIKRASREGENSQRCQKMLRDCQNDVCKPSSGFFALMMAAQMCNQIDMYGFESYRLQTSGRRGPRYHYFDEEVGTTSVHSFVLIMKVFEFLSHRYPITVKTPHYDPEKERLKELQETKANKQQQGNKSARNKKATGVIGPQEVEKTVTELRTQFHEAAHARQQEILLKAGKAPQAAKLQQRRVL